jgi:hypothetical protein
LPVKITEAQQIPKDLTPAPDAERPRMATTTGFKVQCEACEANISVKENLAGKTISCPKCGMKFKATPPAAVPNKAPAGNPFDELDKGSKKGKGKGKNLPARRR